MILTLISDELASRIYTFEKEGPCSKNSFAEHELKAMLGSWDLTHMYTID